MSVLLQGKLWCLCWCQVPIQRTTAPSKYLLVGVERLLVHRCEVSGKINCLALEKDGVGSISAETASISGMEEG